MKFANCTSCALNCESSNDFLNCCTRMSVRLLDIPHRKNSTVTRTNSAVRPGGKTGATSCEPVVVGFVTVDTCTFHSYRVTQPTAATQLIWHEVSLSNVGLSRPDGIGMIRLLQGQNV